MRLLFAAIFILASSLLVKAQDNATLASQDVCHCIDSLKNLSFKAKTDSCLIKASVKAMMREKKVPSTVEGMRKFFGDVKTLTYKNCPDYRQGYNEEASEAYDKLSANEEANRFYKDGTEKMKAKNYDEAIAELEKAVKLDKQFLYAIDHLAVCYRQKNDYDTSLKYYKQSLTIFPAGNLSLLNTAVVYTLKKDLKSALYHYEQLRYYYPKDAEGYFGASKILAINGDFEASLDNAFNAFFIYREINSPYMDDWNKLIQIIYTSMKAKNLQDLFQKKAAQYNVNVNIK